LHQSFI
jgi:separase